MSDQVFTGDSGQGGTAGLVPAPAQGDGAQRKYLCADGVWQVIPPRPPGANGSSILTGQGAPGANTGNPGDVYIDVAAMALYGQKSPSGWGNSIPLIGPPGEPGVPGEPGAAGNTIIPGEAPPALSTGNPGDFYIDTVAWLLYGPKQTGSWGNPVTLAISPTYTPGAPAATGYLTLYDASGTAYKVLCST